jgi:hypothetical protein
MEKCVKMEKMRMFACFEFVTSAKLSTVCVGTREALLLNKTMIDKTMINFIRSTIKQYDKSDKCPLQIRFDVSYYILGTRNLG